jgi:hypothetical protein
MISCIQYGYHKVSKCDYHPHFFLSLLTMPPPSIRARLRNEIEQLYTNPPKGIFCWPMDDETDNLNHLTARKYTIYIYYMK